MRNKAQRMASLFGGSLRDKVHPTPPIPRRSKSAPNKDDMENEDEELFEVVKETAWDGVRYLGSEKKSTRLMWMIIIILFIILSSIQIYFQVKQYMDEPVSTNIEVEYPQKIALPTIAICNSNEFRLSHLVHELNANKGEPMTTKSSLKSVNPRSKNPFDQVIIQNADQDAVSFLSEASHQLEDLVMRCVLPDGTACNSTHFKPFWTVDGLCWAFNSDRFNPREVPGSGTSYGLRLLLNLESYDRVESKHKHFRSTSLPGLKILVFNQTDIPHTTSNGLNIPPGFTSYLPITMQQLSKLPRSGCQKESDVSKEAYDSDYLSPANIRACKIRKYLTIIEKECSCSMRGMFSTYVKGTSNNATSLWQLYARVFSLILLWLTIAYFALSSGPLHLATTLFVKARASVPPCTVDDYFGCVREIVKQVSDSGAASKCLPPCESLEFSGSQNLNRIPKSLMPIEHDEISEDELRRLRRASFEEDPKPTTLEPPHAEHVMEEDELALSANIHYVSISEPLEEEIGKMIKRKASFAFESQHKYQDNIAAKFKKLIKNLRNAKLRLFASKWGWDNKVFTNVYTRMTEKHDCVKRITYDYKDIVTYLVVPSSRNEEKKAELLFSIVDPEGWQKNPTKYKSLAEVRNAYTEKAETRRKEVLLLILMTKEMWTVFNENLYSQNIIADLSLMDRIIAKAEHFEDFQGLKEWADEMNSADKIFFVTEEFNEGWYKLIYNDLDKKMVKTLKNVFTHNWPKFEAYKKNGTQIFKTAATLFYGRVPTQDNMTRAAEFYDEMEKCMKEVNGTAVQMLEEFKGLYKKFNEAYLNLFKKELRKVQEKFDFGEDFELQNFAMVNIYLNKMAIEKWSQEETYSFWSLASDVGGALGLFMGASLVSIIEIFIIGFHFGGKFFSRRVTKTVQVVEDYRERKKSRAAMQTTGIDMSQVSRESSAV